MKRIDLSKAMLWRQTRPLLERLEDRLVPGETLSALLLGAGAGWFGGGLPVPSTESSGSAESMAVVRWASSPSATQTNAYLDDSAVDWGDWDSAAPVAVEVTSATDTSDGVTAAPESATIDQIFSDEISQGDFSSVLHNTGRSSGSYQSAHATSGAMMGGGGAAVTPAVNMASATSLGGAQTVDGSGLFSLMASQPTATVTSVSPSVAPVSHATSTAAVVSQAPATTAVASPASDSGGEVAADPNGASPMLKGNPTPQANPAGYSPQQIRHAYGFDLLSQNGAGQTIYIIDAYHDSHALSDLQTFDAQYGLPNPPSFTVATPQGLPKANSGWIQEESLDIQWAHAVAPSANIVLVEAKTNSNTNLYGAIDYAVNQGAHIVSMSWGGGDSSSDTSFDSHFNHSGVAFFASSGDTGGQVIYPSASPYVVSVGGTSLPLDANGNRTGAESAWSSGGGGVSVGESRPGYQSAYGLTYSGRATPDVSYNSDPNTGVAVYDRGWLVFGGTSAAAPQWAGLAALVDQSRSTPLSSANLTSRFDYSAATGTAYASNYNDITTGSNGFPAGPGYDLATGLGSPQANNLVPYLISH